MLHDKIIAAIRTGCAVLGAAAVATLLRWLAGWGIEVELDPELSSILAVLLFGVFVALYNLAVAWLTENVWDGFGWLLGVNKAPAYVEADLRTDPEGIAVDDTALPNVTGGEDWRGYLESGDTNPDRA